MKGSSNDPSPPAFRPGLVVFEFGKTFGATYTFRNRYATTVPDGVSHNQFSSRRDFTGGTAYDH